MGRALALRALGREKPRVFCVLGDGELAEGSNHEAIALAGRLGLDRLVAVIVNNDSATYGWPTASTRASLARAGRPPRRLASDHDALERAIAATEPGKPHAVVALVEE